MVSHLISSFILNPEWTWRFGDSDFMRRYLTAQVLLSRSPSKFSTLGLAVQAADRGDGDEDEDEDKDEDEDEIPNYAVLLTASVESFGVSLMRDFKIIKSHEKVIRNSSGCHEKFMSRSRESHEKVMRKS